MINNKIQIARTIYLDILDTMKKVLDLIGFKLDKRTKDFSYAKSQVMDYFYNNLKKLFEKLKQEGIIEKSNCGHSLRNGYKSCLCGGSGYINAKRNLQT